MLAELNKDKWMRVQVNNGIYVIDTVSLLK